MSGSEPPAEADVEGANWGATQVVDGVKYTLGDGDVVGGVPRSDGDVEVGHPTHPVSEGSTSASTEVHVVGFRLENRSDEAVALPGPAAFELPGRLTPHSDAHHFSVTDPASADGAIRDHPLPSYFRLERTYGAAHLPVGDTVSGLIAYLTDPTPTDGAIVSVVSHRDETLSWRIEGDSSDGVDDRPRDASETPGRREGSPHRPERPEANARGSGPESESDDDTPKTTPTSERAGTDVEATSTESSTSRCSDRPDDPSGDSDPSPAPTAVDEGVTADDEDTGVDGPTPPLDGAERASGSDDRGLSTCPECEDAVRPDHDYCGNCGAALSE